MKICSTCKEVRDIEDFNLDHRRNELRYSCKPCESKRHKNWRDRNKDKEYQRSLSWRKQNRGIMNAIDQKRYTSKKLRMPKWLSKTQQLEIQQIYITANKLTNETGIKYHVDHIIPLQGKIVSGLHVSWNLQILTQQENCQKSNRYEQRAKQKKKQETSGSSQTPESEETI